MYLWNIVSIRSISSTLHYKGHLGMSQFVLYMEFVLTLEFQNELSKYEVLHLGLHVLNQSYIIIEVFSIVCIITECTLREVLV